MAEEKIKIEDLSGKWISYYEKIDGCVYRGGRPQYHVILKVKEGYDWIILRDNARKEFTGNLSLSWDVCNFLSHFGQLKKEPNGFESYCDIEGSMRITDSLLAEYKEYKKRKAERGW